MKQPSGERWCRGTHLEQAPFIRGFGTVPEGWTISTRRPFVDPQAGLAFDLEGIDSHPLTVPPAYEFSSAGQIGEIAENYWLALCRDAPATPLSEGHASPYRRRS